MELLYGLESISIKMIEYKGILLKVTINDEVIHLTPIEYKIMALLCRYQGKVLTHNFIIKEIWTAPVGNETKSLRVFMASLRRKIEKNPAQPQYIYTEVGVGYRMADE